jgi:hypothetical protein
VASAVLNAIGVERGKDATVEGDYLGEGVRSLVSSELPRGGAAATEPARN